MKITANIKGKETIISHPNRFYYRNGEKENYKQFSRVFYRKNGDSYIQIYQYDNEKPIIILDSISQATNNYYVAVSGTVSDKHSGVKSLTINNINIGLNENNKFYTNLTLNYGINHFSAVATDNANNSTTINFTVVRVDTRADNGTNIQYSGHSHQDWVNGLSCKYSDDCDNDLNYSVHGSAQATVTADFYHKYGANYMSLSVNIESGGDTQGRYEWQLMDGYGNILNSYSSGGVGGGTHGITVNTSAYANRTDVFLRVKATSENGGWVSAYGSGGWGATASMTGCTQSV